MHFVYLSSVRGTNTCTLFICHLSIYSFDISVALLWHFKTFLLFKVLIVLILLNYFIIYLVFITEILNVWFKLKPVLHNPYRTPFGTSLISTLRIPRTMEMDEKTLNIFTEDITYMVYSLSLQAIISINMQLAWH